MNLNRITGSCPRLNFGGMFFTNHLHYWGGSPHTKLKALIEVPIYAIELKEKVRVVNSFEKYIPQYRLHINKAKKNYFLKVFKNGTATKEPLTPPDTPW